MEVQNMIEEIIHNIYQIKVPLPNNPLKELNTYLIKGKDNSLLIDAGFRQEECRRVLFDALDKLDVNRDKLDVLATHIHSDHIGLAPEVVGPDRKIYLGLEDFRWSTSQENDVYWRLMDYRYLEEGFPEQELRELSSLNPAKNLGPALDLPNYDYLVEGEVFEIGGHTLEVVEAPGHTKGMLCLWMPEEKFMFTADHVLFDITPNITIWPNMEDSLGTYLDSLKRFRNFPVKRALPGHRHAGDYHARIDELLAHHDTRIQEALEVVQAMPGATAYEIAGKMTWEIRAKNWDEFPVIQKWFAIGEALAHIDYLLQRNRIECVEKHGIKRYYVVA